MIGCRRHFSDLTSTKGVCASCLRQRLFALQHQTEPQNDIVKSPPLPASQPVSSHRISDEAQSEEQHTQMFFTPQHDSTITVIPVVTVVEEETTKKGTAKNSIPNMIMGLFRSKKHDHQDHEKNQSRTFSIDENARGMSPNRDDYCLTETCKQTPRRTPRRNNRYSRNVLGFAICLSPLVRANPNVRCGGQAELCKNRPRKLADFGRNNNNKY